MKKVLSLFMSVVMLLTLTAGLNLTVSAETTADGFEYSILSDNTAEITGYTGTATVLTIPSTLGGYTVTSIGEWAFEDCSNLISVTIPDSVTSIGDNAFSYCYSLTSVTIPNSVTSIGERAFSSCKRLTSITVDENNPNYSSQDGVLFDKNKTTLIQYPSENARTSYEIPDSVTSIGDYAFWCCSNLTSITIPNSVTSIGDNAFSGCYSLINITIPDSVTSIGDNAFSDCYSLTSVTIPNSVTSISICAFASCDKLKSVTIPNSVTSIGDNAFVYCSSLTSVTIPDSVTSIGNDAFHGCLSLTSVTIPNSITSIGALAFLYCSNLTSITIPNSVTSIGNSAFTGCDSLTSITVDENNPNYSSQDGVLFDKNKTILIQYPIGNARTSYEIPDSVTSIGEDAFRYCMNLTSVTIPDSVTSIGSSAFDSCSSLTSVTIPDGVTSIGIWAFSDTAYYNDESNWENNEVLYIGNHLIDVKNTVSGNYLIKENTICIADAVFSHCSSLTSATIPNSVISIGYHAIGYNYDNKKIEGFTIYGTPGTIAERYANDNGFTFIVVENKPSEPPTEPTTPPVTEPTIESTNPPAASQPTTQPTTAPTITQAPTAVTAQDSTTTTTAVALPSGTKLVKGEIIAPKQKNASIKKLKKGKKSLTVYWKKTSGVSGYQVQYSTSKKFTKKTTKLQTVKKNKTTKTTLKKLKSKKTYFVRIRTYKNVKVNGKTIRVYSKWSKTKSVKVK